MAKRTVCLCDGKYIGIETIYTVINGLQINIPEKLEELRVRSRNNELFCPCGCGSNLILVAGDKNLKEQHFRLKDITFKDRCHVLIEGKRSVDSKIVLKCWLDEKLKTQDLETRVPLYLIGDTKRKYEFSFLSKSKSVALSYCHERVNLSDEKFEILEANSQDIHIIYVVDAVNGGSTGQYPEGLMKIQNRQGYCLLLEVNDTSYNNAIMKAVFYAQDVDGIWGEIEMTNGHLCDYVIDDNGIVQFKNKSLALLQKELLASFNNSMLNIKIRREEEKKRRDEEQQRRLENAERRRQEQKKRLEEIEKERKQKLRKEKIHKERIETESQAEFKKQRETFIRDMVSDFTQQETQVRDVAGIRWIMCEFCGKIAMTKEFVSYGGLNHVNLGTCRSCASKKASERTSVITQQKSKSNLTSIKYDADVCPKCGGKLIERSGPYGKFMGCSNFPSCCFSMKIKKGD